MIFSHKNFPLIGWHPRFVVLKHSCTFTTRPDVIIISLNALKQGLEVVLWFRRNLRLLSGVILLAFRNFCLLSNLISFPRVCGVAWWSLSWPIQSSRNFGRAWTEQWKKTIMTVNKKLNSCKWKKGRYNWIKCTLVLELCKQLSLNAFLFPHRTRVGLQWMK